MKALDDPSPSFWHERFLQQARWTHAIRRQLFEVLNKEVHTAILEVGSGTGVIVKELAQNSPSTVVGLDLDIHRLQFSRMYAPECLAVCGDGEFLPFKQNAFDACFCHYLLLWVDDPSAILKEMVRLTRPQGWVLALAEPDYGGRIDHPSALQELGRWQTSSLEAQGADPQMGRRLWTLFLQAGLTSIQVGVLGGQWSDDLNSRQDLEEEWSILQTDLTHLHSPPSLDSFKSAWMETGRILFVPTFYAVGRVPG